MKNFKPKYFLGFALVIPSLIFSYTMSSCKLNNSDLRCDTIQRIDNEPLFTLKGFTKEQTDSVFFYTYLSEEKIFRFKVRGQSQVYREKYDSINSISTYSFSCRGFTQKDSLIFKTKDNLVFFFTDYHYTAKDGDCYLSDTVIVNGKPCFNSVITPDMGIPLDSIRDPFLYYEIFYY